MRYRPIELAAAFILGLLILSAGISAPFGKDAEPQSAQWIQSVARDGHWLLARDYYGFLNPKPPLFYWLSAIVSDLSGGIVDEVRARAVSLIAGAAIAAIVFGWTAANLGRFTGALAFCFLLGSYAFASRATTALTDMLMTALLFAAYLVIYPALYAQPSRLRLAALGVTLGLAILTKGPVALALLLLALVVFCVLTRTNVLATLTRAWLWIAIGIALVIAALWYVPAFAHGQHRAAGIFASENLGHFLPSSLGGTGEAARPVYYILIRMLAGVLPLTPLLVVLPLLLNSPEIPRQIRRALLYQLAMALAVLLLFSAASAKRDDYVLPAMPPLAILFATLLTPVAAGVTARRARSFISALVALVAIVIALGGVAIWMRSGALPARDLDLQSSDASYYTIVMHGFARQTSPFIALEVAYLGGAAIVLFGLIKRRIPAMGSGLAVITLAGTLLWTSTVRPAEARSHTVAAFARQVRDRIDGAPLYALGFDPELSWYYGTAVWPLPRAMRRNGNTGASPIFLVARSDEIQRFSGPIEGHFRALLRSRIQGRGGPPILFEILPD